jgi:hypothetical protein
MWVEPHASDAVALDHALDPHEDLGVDGLRAAVAAPQPPGHGGEQEQRQRRQHQQRGEVDQVLRIQQQAEDVEALSLDIEQHRLAPAPLQPGHAVEEELGEPDEDPAPGGEPALDRARVDLRLLLVHRDELRLVADECDGLDRNDGRGWLGHGRRA